MQQAGRLRYQALSLDHHDYLTLATSVKLAKKYSLPTTQQQLAVVEGNRH
jgi:hypothetical protein